MHHICAKAIIMEENLKNKNIGSEGENESDNELVRRIAEKKYEFGFTTDVPTEVIPVGLSEDVV